jgi:predicted acylesterase/phospholipase RssA
MIGGKKVSLNLVGAGTGGIVTVGYLKAVEDLKIQWDMLYGCSSGALNAVLYHQGDMDKLEELWMNISNNKVFKVNVLHWLNPLVSMAQKNSIGSPAPLRKLLEGLIDPDKIKKQTRPLYITATDIYTYQPISVDLRQLEPDEMVTFVLASASVPIAFPPVAFRDSLLYDGGLVNNYGIYDAINQGADVIIECRPKVPDLKKPVKSLLDAFNVTTGIPEAFLLNRELQFVNFVNKFQDPHPDLKNIQAVVIQPPTGPDLGILDFSYKGYDRKALIQLGYDLAHETLTKELGQAKAQN